METHIIPGLNRQPLVQQLGVTRIP